MKERKSFPFAHHVTTPAETISNREKVLWRNFSPKKTTWRPYEAVPLALSEPDGGAWWPSPRNLKKV